MIIALEQSVINEFRAMVNDKNNLLAKKFINKDGKNKWNILCSAMDWIDVTVKGLPYIELMKQTNRLNSHHESLNLMQVIISVDILVESVRQLHRVLDVEYPFENERSIFRQTQLSDDIYYKHIRAVFGTHPVNLTSIDGIKGSPEKRFYASWSSIDYTTSDTYQVLLYSNDTDTEDQFITLDINDIFNYADSRYQLLNNLFEKVDSIIQNHIDKYKLEKIELPEEKLLQLKMLREENDKRLCSNLSIINYLENMLSINIESLSGYYLSEVSVYQSYLESLITKVAAELESMDFNFVEIPYFFKGYNASKLYEYFKGNDNPIGFALLEKFVTDRNIPETFLFGNDINKQRLIIEALAYKTYQSQGTAIEL